MQAGMQSERDDAAVATNRRPRFDLLDAMKGLAACVVVWHHLTCYAPGSDLADLTAPTLRAWLYDEATFVVQIFFVIGGFALVTALSTQALGPRQALQALICRYIRLAAPYLAMLGMLLAAAWLTSQSIVKPPLISSFSWGQLLAHLFFLQDVLGLGNFAAGTWYLCIDIQYALLFLILSVCVFHVQRRQWVSWPAHTIQASVLAALGLVSMWYWNRIPQLDCYIIYFLSSMVLGSLLAWTLQGRLPKWLIVLYVLSMIASLIVDYRPRLVVALVTAAIIAIGLTSFSAIRIPRCLVWLGRISYSLFLIHYLVNGLVLYAVNPWIGDSPVRALLAETFAFACSLVAAIGLYYAVEVPTHRWLKKVQRRSVDDPAAAPQRSSVTASQVGLPSVAS